MKLNGYTRRQKNDIPISYTKSYSRLCVSIGECILPMIPNTQSEHNLSIFVFFLISSQIVLLVPSMVTYYTTSYTFSYTRLCFSCFVPRGNFMYISFLFFFFKFRFTQLGTAPCPSLTYVRFGTGSNSLKLVFLVVGYVKRIVYNSWN